MYDSAPEMAGNVLERLHVIESLVEASPSING